MKTSVVMATYNGEKFLKKQLNSIVNQTVLPDEIIVVDDTSTDTTLDILDAYSKKYSDKIPFRIIAREENLGYIANFIDGIQKTQNNLIILCDQDDLWVENKIASIKEKFEENSDLITLHTNTNIIDQDDQVLKENVQEYSNPLKKITLLKYVTKVNYPGMAMAFRKDKILPDLMKLFEQTILPTHDWTIGFLACLQDGFYISDEVLTLRRYTGNNVALRMEPSSDTPLEERIKGVELYNQYYTLMKESQKILDISDLDLNPNKYIKNANIRVSYLKQKNIFKALQNVGNVKFYPTKKAYAKDLLLLVRGG